MALVEYAKSELARISAVDEDDDMQSLMNAHIIKMVEMFANAGHSGFSASYAVGILEKLLRYEPLTQLTGEPDEWTEVCEGMWQNKRCSHIFKDAENGPAYDIHGIVWRDPDGCRFTNGESRVEVTFPHTPKSEVRDRPAEQVRA